MASEAASSAAMDRLLNALVGDNASEATRESFRQRIVQNAMNDVEVEVEDVGHLNRIVSALRASDAVAQAERQ